ncbi:hypothetical protein DPMN_123996 [Dreissena polymorpha]|uniref:Uncharacterized protein n=1 Tax=Dreissena polymorpha TaxID=45954 RepID=A0A9D4GSP5_DREPO|nr:hypothetical protein DPMN_123996 [Dreissena polymorpha]
MTMLASSPHIAKLSTLFTPMVFCVGSRLFERRSRSAFLEKRSAAHRQHGPEVGIESPVTCGIFLDLI